MTNFIIHLKNREGIEFPPFPFPRNINFSLEKIDEQGFVPPPFNWKIPWMSLEDIVKGGFQSGGILGTKAEPPVIHYIYFRLKHFFPPDPKLDEDVHAYYDQVVE